MEKKELKVGDIVQINPERGRIFGGALMIVTEPKEWGAQGCVHVLGNSDVAFTFNGLAYYRCEFEDMELVGHAAWIRKTDEEMAEEVN